ncbi:MAG: nucleotidyltransferase domain-containing protein [Bacteroidetes bacterium]|nr:nucleotidyltransferase domain-containing protein [Bacteroidota bacterium]
MNELNKIKETKTQKLLDELKQELLEKFSNRLIKIIVYGSYARGEYSTDSDIDIYVLTSMIDEEIKSMEDAIVKISVEIVLKYDILVSIHVKNISHFNNYFDTLPLYSNIIREGIELYGK